MPGGARLEEGGENPKGDETDEAGTRDKKGIWVDGDRRVDARKFDRY